MSTQKETWQTTHYSVTQQFDEEELKLLTFALEVDWDELPGDRKSAKVQSLMVNLARQDRLDALLQELKKQRPSHPWPNTIQMPPLAGSQPTTSHASNRITSKTGGSIIVKGTIQQTVGEEGTNVLEADQGRIEAGNLRQESGSSEK